MKQIFESENIRFVAVSERLVQDYLIMVNDIEHVEKFIGGWHEPFTEEQEIRWVQKKLAEKANLHKTAIRGNHQKSICLTGLGNRDALTSNK